MPEFLPRVIFLPWLVLHRSKSKVRSWCAAFGRRLVQKFDCENTIVGRMHYEQMVKIQTWLEPTIKRHYVEGVGEYVYRVKEIWSAAYGNKDNVFGRYIGWQREGDKRICQYGLKVVGMGTDKVHSDPRELLSMFYRLTADVKSQGINWLDPKVSVEMSLTKDA